MRRCLIVGLGGIGSWLADGLVRTMEFKDPGSMLILVDGDHYEPKNLERQSFTKPGNKAEVKAADLTPLFPKTFIAAMAKWVVPEIEEGVAEDDDFVTPEALMAEGDIVFSVVDNHATRKLLFDAARNYDNIDVFTGGNDDKLFASLYHYRRRDGKDVTDHPAEYHEEFIDPPDRNPGELSCAERAELEGGTQLIATNMAVAAWLLGKVNHVIFGDANPVPAAEIHMDLGVGALQAYDRNPEVVVTTAALN